MSFILDALKKSENERQRSIGPSLADAPMRRHQADRPWWAFAVAALLIVNLGVLLLVLTRNDDKPAPAAAAAAPPVPAAVAATPAPVATAPPPAPRVQQRQATPVVTNPSVRSLAEEADAYDDSYSATDALGAPSHLASAANVPPGPSIVRPIEAPAVAPLPSTAAAAARFASEGNSEPVPTMNALAATGVSLPDLHLDIHVYSTQPAERFIFVNMRKYHEGDTMSEGPTVERITAEGAVVNQQGQRFLLPRP